MDDRQDQPEAARLAWCDRLQELRGTSERIAMFEAKLDRVAKVEGQDHPPSPR